LDKITIFVKTLADVGGGITLTNLRHPYWNFYNSPSYFENTSQFCYCEDDEHPLPPPPDKPLRKPLE